MARVDYDKQSEVYDRGRTLPPEGVEMWMVTARRHVGEASRVLDLGSGTGRFSGPLAQTFDADVYAIEPSAGMRDRARTKPDPRVHVIAGAAESLPLPDASCELAWLSNVVHHFDDIPAAARELRRTLAAGAPILIRGAFGEQPVPSLYRFFPGTKRFVDSFPTIAEVIETFEAVGFGSFYQEKVKQLLAYSFADIVPRMRTRADTTLELLTDKEFEQGMAALERAAQEERGPVYDHLDLLVVR